MKRYFLSYGELTKDYYLDSGCFDRNRIFLGKIKEQELVKSLKEEIPSHREAVIYTQKNLELTLKDILLEGFKGTRIKVQFEKDIEKLC